MYLTSVENAAKTARAKADYLTRSPVGYLMASVLAGAYVGLGIVLIFCIGAPVAEADSVFLKVLMGVSFGIALTLVVFAGSELFTGNNMFMTIGCLRRQTSFQELLQVWIVSWIGNILGSLILAWMVVNSGAVVHASALLNKVAALKMTMPADDLFLRAVLCNWLVCLAIWTSSRTQSDAAKCILIFWCLFAFIACGYEHSVANMTLLALPLLGVAGDAVTWEGFWRNIGWVTLGNIVGGALFVAGAYCLTVCKEKC